MAFLAKLLLCLAFVGFTAYETRSLLLNFNKPNGSVLSFLGAVAFASVAWFWVYLTGLVLVYGEFVANSLSGGIVASCVIVGFISSCLACYVLFYKDMPKGPTR